MTISKEEFEHIKARTTATQVALAYAITNLSAKFSDIKPSVTSALRKDAKLNEAKNKPIAEALVEFAELIDKFTFTDKP